ncbi:transglycosylase domain-containing protein [Euzebya tangerina]|uniref:transglycosylase domain-containing protein n=1 Tax=Euzebya tangerina TaxID=591198 RepID=UPI000E31FD3B|nr:transglycosylase domain-containing protein [Euzebya tangerina]
MSRSPRGWSLVSLLLACALLGTACSPFVQVGVAEIDLEPAPQFEQSFVYAADGSLIATLRFNNREPVTHDDLPEHLIHAIVAAEDRRFFDHDGVDARAIARAWVANRRAGTIVQGGSTITQQLIKNRYFPEAENTLERKSTEAHLAMQLERTATKSEILTDYLNTIYLGAGAYGIEAAAQTYFGVTTSDLDVGQAALIAGLIRSPEADSPYTNPRGAVEERRRVTAAMTAEGYLSRPDAVAINNAPLGVIPPPEPPATRYPFFVELVKRTLVNDPTFGLDEPTRWQRLFGGGLRIHTTIDPALQATAEAAATRFWNQPSDPEVALSVVRPQTGDIVAMVGGRDFETNQFDLATQGRRQPGSTFKVFGLVAALNSGWRLDQTIQSGSGTFDLGSGDPWSVRSGTSGRITLRQALASSSNGAFARLALDMGAGAVERTAVAMGVTSEIGVNPSTVLGGLREGVSPMEMAGAFATLANDGVHAPPRPITEVTDADGQVVWEPSQLPRVAMDAQTAYLVTSAMVDAVEEGTGGQAQLPDRPVAGKTGTVQNNADAWFVGFTPELSTAVWIGYPESRRPLLNIHGEAVVQGGNWPARIWRTFMAEALEGEPVREFTPPAELVETVLVDPLTGGIATPYCPTTVEVTGVPGELPTFTCPLHTAPPAVAAPLPVQPPEPAPVPTIAVPVTPVPTLPATPTPAPTPTPTLTPTPTPTPGASVVPAPEPPPPPPGPTISGG